jgi:integrase
VLDFLEDVGDNIKRITLLNYWKDLELFFRFLLSEGLVDSNLLHDVPKPRLSPHEQERDARFLPYTEAEFRSLLESTPHWNWLGKRNQALLWVLWDTPLRLGELVNLRIADVDWDSDELLVCDGKGGVRYEGVLSQEGALSLSLYVEERPHESDYLFIDIHGGPMTRHAVEQMLRQLAMRAHWKKPCFPHAFRINWRLRMRGKGLDDTAISALMGHSSVAVTQGYGRRIARQMAKAQLRNVLSGLLPTVVTLADSGTSIIA